MARGGLVARGVVYVVIGVLSIKLAAGARGQTTGQRGALETIAHQPLGGALLLATAIGLGCYAAWRLIRAAIGRGAEQVDSAFDRVAGLTSGIAYAVLCFTAVEILAGAGGGAGSPKKATGGVLGWTAGPAIVVIAGAVLAGIGLYQGYKGFGRTFLETSNTERMGPAMKRAFTAFGIFGHIARMVVFGLIGYGVIKAALDYNPHQAVGLDGALNRLASASYGPILLGIVAAGLIGFGVYSIIDARYRRV
jgi:hypothetical protein